MDELNVTERDCAKTKAFWQIDKATFRSGSTYSQGTLAYTYRDKDIDRRVLQLGTSFKSSDCTAP